MFKENEKKLKELREETRKVKDALREEYLDHFRSEYPGEIESLEKKLGGEIEFIEPLQYVYDATYCNVVCIHFKDKPVQRFAIHYGEEWDADMSIVDFIYDIEDEDSDMFLILEKIYIEFPFIDTEYLN